MTHYVLVIMFFTNHFTPTGRMSVIDLPPNTDAEVCRMLTRENPAHMKQAKELAPDAAHAMQFCRPLEGEFKR